mgnify:CR=1 FL=1
MLVSEIYTRIAMTLQDLTKDRWTWEWSDGDTDLSLQPLMNQAIQAVVYQRPDAMSTTETVSLDAGAKQTVPTGSYQLIEAIRNMGTDGSTPGKTITPVDRRVLDQWNRTWMNKSAISEIDHWAYDRLYNRKIFWVYPPAPSGLHIELTHAPEPTLITSSTDEFPLPDIYADPIYHHVLFQIFAGDNSDANFERGMNHWKVFTQKMNMKTQTDMAMSQGSQPSKESD